MFYLQGPGFTRKYSLSCKTGTLLPDFPPASYLLLPQDTSKEKVKKLRLFNVRSKCIHIIQSKIMHCIILTNIHIVH